MVYFMGANRNSKELQVTPYCMWDKYEVRNITIEQLREPVYIAEINTSK